MDPEPLGPEGPMVGDKHVDLRRSVRVHVEGQDLLQPRALAHVIIGDLMDGGGLGRDRRGRRDEVGSDEDDLPAYKIDSAPISTTASFGAVPVVSRSTILKRVGSSVELAMPYLGAVA